MNKDKYHYTFSITLDEYSYSEFEDFSNKLTNNSILYILLESSSGGSMKYLNNIQEILKQLRIRNIEVLMFGKYFVSAYLKLFITADIRIIDKNSWGMLHLPVLTQRAERNLVRLTPKEIIEIKAGVADLRIKSIDFIKSRTKLTETLIINFNEKKLNAAQLLEYGIATEIVDNIDDYFKRS